MAKVSLRIYNREIEGLIDQGHINEAIAHCHHILKTFPKHLATYRLLGKAYLELKRYNDAVDIFSRVLMSVPDDFVASVGMSIIRDEENKLDEAIWHMQRAFESQPSNSAIQAELQRLFARRDGVEPSKIRMTRGALAQMYVQGELYPQAIAEIRAVLSQEPDRADMQVLLARAYFRAGQKTDATDMCTQLLKRYLYCLDANRIMVDLLPATATAVETTQVYRMRVGELDPYANFAKGSIFLSNEVPDASVNLERLDYKEEEQPANQGWGAPLGLAAASAPVLSTSTGEPDWLKGGGVSSSEPAPDLQAAPKPNEEIPDFLRAAGWGTSTTPETPTSIFDEEPAGDLTPADLPDWLKGQVPTSMTQPTAPQPAPAQSIETPDWLSGLGETPAAQPAAKSADVPDWLSGLGATAAVAETPPAEASDTPEWLRGLGVMPPAEETPAPPAPEPAQPAEAPDWLSGLGSAAPGSESADIPDWLKDIDSSQTPSGNGPDAVAMPPSEPAQSIETPDWLSGLGEPSAAQPGEAQPADLPDWLSGLEKPQPESSQAEGIPEWMSGVDSQSKPVAQPTASVESLGATAQEQDDAVAWLESLAAKHGAKPEELVTDPNKRSETTPEWVAQAQTIEQQPPISQMPAPSVESLGSTAQEQDDAVAWLESLAARHGAKPEELVTDPNKRSETPPEWISQAQSIGEAEASRKAEEEKFTQKPEAVENALNIGEQFFAEFENTSKGIPPSATDETGMWLRDLEEKESQPEAAEKRGDIPDWLSESQPAQAGSQFDFAEKESGAQKAELPDWLSGVEDESTAKEPVAGQAMAPSDLSNWLSSLDNEPGLPFEELPTPDSIMFGSKRGEEKLAKAKPDLPDWLSDVDSQHEVLDEEWQKPAEPSASKLTEEPAPGIPRETPPDWLKGVEQEELAKPDETSPWLREEIFEAEEAQQPTPTSPSDWKHVEPKPTPGWKEETPPVESRKAFVSPPAEPRAYAERPVEQRPTAPPKKKPGLPAKQRQAEGQGVAASLSQAKGELDRGDIPAALDHYRKLIKKGKHLDETIRDLTESIYRYPVEVGIWQTLGDAYMRANRLKEALEAYNKAEELIR